MLADEFFVVAVLRRIREQRQEAARLLVDFVFVQQLAQRGVRQLAGDPVAQDFRFVRLENRAHARCLCHFSSLSPGSRRRRAIGERARLSPFTAGLYVLYRTKVEAPNRLETNSTASSAVRLRTSSAGL